MHGRSACAGLAEGSASQLSRRRDLRWSGDVQSASPSTTPVTSLRPAPEAWRRALLVAEGDHRRLTVNADGTVSVSNQPVRGPQRLADQPFGPLGRAPIDDVCHFGAIPCVPRTS